MDFVVDLINVRGQRVNGAEHELHAGEVGVDVRIGRVGAAGNGFDNGLTRAVGKRSVNGGGASGAAGGDGDDQGAGESGLETTIANAWPGYSDGRNTWLSEAGLRKRRRAEAQ